MKKIDLDMLANDLAAVLSEDHGIDVGATDVRRALVPFVEAIAPGVLTDGQRFGVPEADDGGQFKADEIAHINAPVRD